jgi:hypothetical protein
MMITTHPIRGKVANTSVADSIFDGITYSKGAATMKQLLFLMKEENFSKALGEYFHKYEWNNATIEDFLEYMQRHFRHSDSSEGIAYSYSQIDIQSDGSLRKYMGSTAGGDEGGQAIPCYEQIYALAGPTQTYRLTGTKNILVDIQETISFLNRYYKDHGPYGGYYSHIDPVTFDPKAESLGVNKAKKNWNSVGDHAPAYLINLYLATEKQEYSDFLEYTFDTICEYFPDYGYSPFMNEKFYDDWNRWSRSGSSTAPGARP